MRWRTELVNGALTRGQVMQRTRQIELATEPVFGAAKGSWGKKTRIRAVFSPLHRRSRGIFPCPSCPCYLALQQLVQYFWLLLLPLYQQHLLQVCELGGYNRAEHRKVAVGRDAQSTWRLSSIVLHTWHGH